MLRRNAIVGLIALGLFSTSLSAIAADVPGGMSPALFKTLDGRVGEAMTAYNAGDWQKFYKDYSKTLAATETKLAFDTLYTNMARKQFGNFKSRKLNPARSSFPSGMPNGLLEYNATMDKGPAILDVNFVKEGGDYKIQQIQFRK